jgi:hypothetical protein
MIDDNTLFPQIVRHRDHRVFTLSEARALFPLVQRITREAHEELEPVRRRLEALVPGTPDLAAGIETEYESVVRRWMGKMERLGLVVKGLWLVDFDTGDGFLCWRFPELKIGHYHGYQEGFAQRRPLAEVLEELDPDWARL